MKLPDIDSISFSEDADVDTVDGKLYESGLTDGLPIIPPTRARVYAMLGAMPADKDLGTLPPLNRPITARALAICAVMSGCTTEHFPALISSVKALQEPAFNLLGVLTTTGNTAIGCILHGPYSTAISANSDSNCLGPGNHANAVIGRALSLTLRNLAGARPGILDMATLGQPAKYTFCFAESTHGTPWSSLAHDRGLASGESAITVFAASSMIEVVDMGADHVEELLDLLARSASAPGAAGAPHDMLGGGEAIFLLPPEWAGRIADSGWSKRRAGEYIYDNGHVGIEALSPLARKRLSERSKLEGSLPIARSPGDVVLVVAGGVGAKAMFVQTWPGGTYSCTIPIYNL